MIALSPGRGGFNPHRDWIPFIQRYARVERISLHVIVYARNCGETRDCFLIAFVRRRDARRMAQGYPVSTASRFIDTSRDVRSR